jgi:putative hemolysin
MRKAKLIGKIFGMALVFVMVGVVLCCSSSIIDSTGEVDIVGTVEVTPQEHSNCGCSSTGSSGFQNPAAGYCTKMGYEYKTVVTEAGERGICVLPNGDEVDAWAFYRGECAPEFSYCAKMGWPVAVQAQSDSYSDKCCTCVLPDGSHKTVSELLDLGPDYTVAVDSPVGAGSQWTSLAESQGELPESFDWRNEGGQDWMTPVKDQGSCNCCWAFAAVGTAEAQYNICYGDATLDLDLSEQYLVSDCCNKCGNCELGSPSYALEFIRDEGITDEDCFPYAETDCSCSKRCLDWGYRLYTVDATGHVPSGRATIEEYLVYTGPLAATMRLKGGTLKMAS